MDETELRPCARGARCAGASSVRTETGWERVPAVSPRPLCDGDRERVRHTLARLPGRYVSLWGALGVARRVGGGDGSAHAKPGSRVPLNVGIDALMREMVEVTESWELRVRTVARLTGRRAGALRRGHLSLVQACDTLVTHSEALLSLETGEMLRSRDLADRRRLPDEATVVRYSTIAGWAVYALPLDGTGAAVEIFNLEARCRAALFENRAPQHLEVRCATCGQRTLQRYDGWAGLEDEATCTTCGDVYSNQRYLLLLREEHELALARKKLRGRRPRSPRLQD